MENHGHGKEKFYKEFFVYNKNPLFTSLRDIVILSVSYETHFSLLSS